MASSPPLDLDDWIVMRPIISATSRGLGRTAALSVTTLLPHCSGNNCFAGMLAVLVSRCIWYTILSGQRLSGPVDWDKVTGLGSNLCTGGVLSFGCTFYKLASSGRKISQDICDSPRTGQCVTDVCFEKGTHRPEFWVWLFVSQLAWMKELNITSQNRPPHCKKQQHRN